MERKWVFLTAAVSVVLLAAVIWVGVLLGQNPQQSADAPRQGSVVINEIMSANENYPDGQGRRLDYIELYNPTDVPTDISNYKITDKEDFIGYTFPQGTVVQPKTYMLLQCDPDGGAGLNFGISKDGEKVYLYNSANVCVQTVAVPAMRDDQAYIRDANGAWRVESFGTPGFENTAAGYEAWLLSVGISSVSVVFNEMLCDNVGGVINSSGEFCDWFELYNPADTPAVLDGYYVSDDPEKPFKWQLTDLTVPADSYVLICCNPDNPTPGEAPFGLSKNGGSLVLTGPVTNFITKMDCPSLEENTSFRRLPDGTYAVTEEPTPGYPNTAEGYEAYRASRQNPGPLAIMEVMPANDRYLIQSDGETYDWVELKNVSAEPINLADFAISDDSSDPRQFRLPEQTLEPGELVVIILSGNTQLTGRYIHAPFALNRQEFRLFVSCWARGYSDYIHVTEVPFMGTVGRGSDGRQLLYFDTPTPGQENTGGYSDISNDPFVETPGGIYNDVTQVSVVLSGEGEIYYTLDGSLPTVNSRRYTEPIILTKSTNIRAFCKTEGKLPSPVVTSAYIINENHTLPVLSVTADPNAMFGYSGIYTQYSRDIEIPCNLTLYEENGSFSVDCGIEMYGHTGLQMPKKSFKVNFRSEYGSPLLTYPVYGEDGPEVYDSLVIRSGQDYPYAIFRDELFTNLCRQMSDNVLAQKDKFCILYINGEYRGIYCLKEAFSEFYYATNRNVTEESVELVQAPVYVNTEIYKFMSYLGTHDITDPDNYAYACTVFNMESLIDWIIIQGYSTNGDVQQNLRYFRSSDNGNTYEMAFYDLDWAFYYHLPFTDVLSNDRENWQHLMLTRRLIKNPSFRQLFLERLSYFMETTLSNENVLATIDYYQELLAPEVARERARWGGSVSGWEFEVNVLRAFITKRDHLNDMVNRLVRYIGLTQQEIDTYFWRWA